MCTPGAPNRLALASKQRRLVVMRAMKRGELRARRLKRARGGLSNAQIVRLHFAKCEAITNQATQMREKFLEDALQGRSRRHEAYATGGTVRTIRVRLNRRACALRISGKHDRSALQERVQAIVGLSLHRMS